MFLLSFCICFAQSMSIKYKFRDPDQLYFITFAVVNWLDIFTRSMYRDIVVESWRHCIQHKGMELYGWCIMTNHIHMIAGSHQEKMQDIMRDMKKYTASKLFKAISTNRYESRREWLVDIMRKCGAKNKTTFQLWQPDNHPIELSSMKIAHQKLDYIHNNPVVAGIVQKPEDYLYSSARDYYGMKGLIDITLLDPLIC